MEEQNEFKARRQSLYDAAQKSLEPQTIKDHVKEKFKGRGLNVIADDKTYSISIDFVAYAADPENNKIKYQKDATLAIEGSVHSPIERVTKDATWLLAQAAQCRVGDHLQGRKAARV